MAGQKVSGKSYRIGLTFIQVMDMLPDRQVATAWFEQKVWGASG